VLEAAHFLLPKSFHKAFDLASSCCKINLDSNTSRRKGKINSTGGEKANAFVTSVKSTDLPKLNL
jgi:hypothetical protein